MASPTWRMQPFSIIRGKALKEAQGRRSPKGLVKEFWLTQPGGPPSTLIIESHGPNMGIPWADLVKPRILA
eukprot:5035159-Amphidinium_carterae.1